MKVFPPLNLARKFGVITLGLWLAGAGCLLGCEGMVKAVAAQSFDKSTSSQHNSSIVAEGNACSSSERHGCCKKTVRKTRPTSAAHNSGQPVSNRSEEAYALANQVSTENRLDELPSSGMRPCPFSVSRELAVARVHDGQMDATAAVSYKTAGGIIREQTLFLATLSTMPNRGHTYLRCCSFLI
jgi:hypothetical protein